MQLPIKRNCVFAKHHHHGVDPIRPNDDGRPLRARGPLIPLPYCCRLRVAAVISIAHRPYVRGAYTFSFSNMMREFSLDIYSERQRIHTHTVGVMMGAIYFLLSPKLQHSAHRHVFVHRAHSPIHSPRTPIMREHSICAHAAMLHA